MWTAFRFTILTFILFGLVYPLLITGLGQVLFPAQANGSLIRNRQGQAIGSELIGQNFTQPQYFHSRLSVNHYDAANSGGTNWGSTNQKLIKQVVLTARTYQQENQIQGFIPIDAVTASGSGLDPHISLASALAQVPRIASSRQQNATELRQWVLSQAEQPLFSHAPYVNVLKLNLSLDRQ